MQSKFNLITVFILLFSALTLYAASPKQTLLFSPETAGFGSEQFSKPSISPDGTKIIFTNKNFSKLWLGEIPDKNNAKTGKPEIIAESSNCGLNARWMNNKNIIFLTDDEGRKGLVFHTICVYNLADKKITKLTAPSLEKKNPVIQGNKILIPNSWIDTSTQKSHLRAKEEAEKFITEILPIKFNQQSNDKLNSVSVISIDDDSSTASQELPEYIYYIDNLKLLKMKLKSGEITNIDDRIYSYSLSQNSKKIVFCKNNNVFIQTLETGITVDIGEGTQPEWIDDDTILFVKTLDNGHETTSSDIYIAEIDKNGKARNITSSPNEFEYYPQFDNNSGRIYFSSMKNNCIKFFEYKKK